MKTLKIGMVARADQTGLGCMSRDFIKWMKPDSALLLELDHMPGHECMVTDFTLWEHLPDYIEHLKRLPTLDDYIEFLDGARPDVMFFFESPFDWGVFDLCRDLGIKTVLDFNYEYLEDPLPSAPDVLWIKIDWYRKETEALCEQMGITPWFQPLPIDRERFPFKQKTEAKTFLFVLGNWKNPQDDRNGFETIELAIPLVKNQDIRFVIRTIQPLPDESLRGDPRVTVYTEAVEDAADFYKDADVLVLPRRYAGTSLPMNEALSCGMPVLMTDMAPQNKILLESWLIDADIEPYKIRRDIQIGTIDPNELSAHIEWIANKSIHVFSRGADQIAESISWEHAAGRFRSMCEELVNEPTYLNLEEAAPSVVPDLIRNPDDGPGPESGATKEGWTPDALEPKSSPSPTPSPMGEGTEQSEAGEGFGSALNIAFIGNFTQDHCTEVHLLKELEGMGHKVQHYQENEPGSMARILSHMDYDLIFYMHTNGWDSALYNRRGGNIFLERCSKEGIPTVTISLDLYHGLPRAKDVTKDCPQWGTDYVFTADGGHDDEWKRLGINHHFMSPAVFSKECYIGTPRPEMACDVLFVGSVENHHPEWTFRKELIENCTKWYGDRFAVWGNHENPIKERRFIRGADLNDLYASAKVVIGDSLYSPHYWSDRFFETWGRGGLLLFPWHDELRDLMGFAYPHYAIYRTPEGYNFGQIKELIDQHLSDYLIEVNDEYKNTMMEAIKQNHTYAHRLQDIIDTLRKDGAFRKSEAKLERFPNRDYVANEDSRDDDIAPTRPDPEPADDRTQALNLGCGNDIRKSDDSTRWVNVDCIKDIDHPDYYYLDLNIERWLEFTGADEFKENQYDQVRAIDILEHLDNPTEIINEMIRITKPGGQIIIQVPDAQFPAYVFIDPQHKRGYSPSSLDYWEPSKNLCKHYGLSHNLGKYFIQDLKIEQWPVTVGATVGGNIKFTFRKKDKS